MKKVSIFFNHIYASDVVDAIESVCYSHSDPSFKSIDDFHGLDSMATYYTATGDVKEYQQELRDAFGYPCMILVSKNA